MMAKKMLEGCPIYTVQITLFWPTPATFKGKVYVDVNNLKVIVAFLTYIQVDV